MDLVTGGTGIVGAHVIDALLAEGRGVRALVRADADRSIVRRVLAHYQADGAALYDRIEWAQGDLFDTDSLVQAMQDVEHVFHCAAIVSFDPRDRPALFATNIEGTANVVNAALAAGVKRLCHVSSTATIGKAPNGKASDETYLFEQDKHSSAYAISKFDAELEVQRGIAEGLDAVMVNPCVVIGPGVQGRSSMTMIERMRKGTRFFTSGTNAVVDARDVAAAMVRLVNEGATGERYLLIGESISYKALFSLIAKSAGKPAPTMHLPAWLLSLAWRFEALRTLFGGRPMITRQTARTASRTRDYDGSKVVRTLNLSFRPAGEAIANVSAFLAR